MTFDDIAGEAAARHLAVFAALHDGDRTLVLLGPGEPGFWDHLTGQPEWRDDAPDPVDRWSRRVIGGWADRIGAEALFPFGGPPWLPFIGWARDSGWVHSSPVGLLVHAEAGLWVSFRGALAIPGRLALPAPPASPCDSCTTRPCLTACPVGALGPDGAYDVPGCKAFLGTPDGAACMSRGCGVRASCPVSRLHGRVCTHSAYHMTQFL
ncbi:MAG: ferredoxin [Pseudooceanicola sp.]